MGSTVMGMLLYSDNEEYVSDINNIYKGKDIAKVDANLRWVVGSTFVKEDSKIADKYFDLYLKTPDATLKRDLTDAITNMRDHDRAIAYLAHLKDGTVRPQDRLIFYLRLLRNHHIKDEVLDWMFANWDWLRQEEGDKTISEYPRYAANLIRRTHEAEKYKNFFNKYKNESILARDIAVGISEIDSRLKLYESDRDAVFAILDSLC